MIGFRLTRHDELLVLQMQGLRGVHFPRQPGGVGAFLLPMAEEIAGLLSRRVSVQPASKSNYFEASDGEKGFKLDRRLVEIYDEAPRRRGYKRRGGYWVQPDITKEVTSGRIA